MARSTARTEDTSVMTFMELLNEWMDIRLSDGHYAARLSFNSQDIEVRKAALATEMNLRTKSADEAHLR